MRIYLTIRHQARPLIASLALFGFFGYFVSIHPQGVSIEMFTAWANQGSALGLVAAGQTIVVMSSGIDLSVGAIMALANCLASQLLHGNPIELALGIIVVGFVGAACGALNGVIIVYARIQPLVATLATGSIYAGLALIVRPAPGGEINYTLSEAMTGNIAGAVPTSLLLLFGFILIFWGPIRASALGRAILAAGSAEPAAYMSGIAVNRAKIAAYILAGIFAALGGLFLSFQTLSGDPSIGQPYTLNSVAAVVIGGTALKGGAGSVLGSISGALILSTIASLIFFTDLAPFAQPLFEGAVLLIAVALGATRLLYIRNRLEVFR